MKIARCVVTDDTNRQPLAFLMGRTRN